MDGQDISNVTLKLAVALNIAVPVSQDVAIFDDTISR